MISEFLERVRSENRRLSSVDDDDRLLGFLNVTTANGELTLAGNYALGFYPQGADPALNVTLAEQLPRNEGKARTRDLVRLGGPIPVLLEESVRWVQQHLRVEQRYDATGHMVDHYELPMNAVREAIANALVHRNLGPDTLGVDAAVDIRLTDKALIITNPGGLQGLTVERLKNEETYRHEVNQRLYAMSRYLRTRDGKRVIEGEGGGVREMLFSAREAGLPDPELLDTGVRFTVKMWRPLERAAGVDFPRKNPHSRSKIGLDLAQISKNAPVVGQAVVAMGEKGATLSEIVDETQLNDGRVRYALKSLIKAGLVEMAGRQGDRTTVYRWLG